MAASPRLGNAAAGLPAPLPDAFPVALHLFPDAPRGRGRLAVALTLWGLASALVIALTARPRSPEVWEDECYWIGSAYYFDLAWRQHDWSHPDWQLLPARENPPLAKYVIGTSLALTGERVGTPDILGAFYLFFARVPGAWGEGEAREKRAAVVARMTESIRRQLSSAKQVNFESGLYVPPRLAMIACTLLTSLLVLLLARSAMSDAAALAASQLTLLHPVANEAMNHVFAEGVLLLCSAAAAWAVLALLRALTITGEPRHPPVTRVLIAGALLGLACAAKMNALTVVLTAGAALAWLAADALVRREFVRARSILLSGLGVVAMGLATFIALNPTLHTDLVDGLIATVREHRLTAGIQTGIEGLRLDSPILRIAKTSTLFAFHPWAWLVLAVPAAACLRSRRLAVRFAGGWWLIAGVAVVAWLPLARLRYTAPLLLPTALIVGFTLDALLRRLRPSAPASTASA